MDNMGLSSHIQVLCSCTHWARRNLTTRQIDISIPTSTQETGDGQGFQAVLKCIPYQNTRILVEKLIYWNPGHVSREVSLSVRPELTALGALRCASTLSTKLASPAGQGSHLLIVSHTLGAPLGLRIRALTSASSVRLDSRVLVWQSKARSSGYSVSFSTQRAQSTHHGALKSSQLDACTAPILPRRTLLARAFFCSTSQLVYAGSPQVFSSNPHSRSQSRGTTPRLQRPANLRKAHRLGAAHY